VISPHLSKIAAFYPADEPQGALADMNDYAVAVGLIQNKTASIPILEVVTAYAVLTGALSSIPPGVDWIGFDQYGCWTATECNEAWDKTSITDKFQIVVSAAKQTAGRKVIIIPDAIVTTGSIPTEAAQQQKVQMINNYYLLCKNEPLCVGMFPFLWDKYPNGGSTVIGANKMPIVENRLKQIGLEVKPSPTLTLLPSDLDGNNIVDIFDNNTLISNFGHTGSPAWISSDIDNNGIIDMIDFNTLVENFGKVL
jgi:hypothetical protein